MTDSDTLKLKAEKEESGSTLEEADIDPSWLFIYRNILHRYKEDRPFGLIRYSDEQGPNFQPINNFSLEHLKWTIRLYLKNHASLQPLLNYETS